MRNIKIIYFILAIAMILGVLAYWRYGNIDPSISLISPNGGETLQKGSVYTIKWETHNIPIENKISVHIKKIDSSTSPIEGQEFDPIIFTNLVNNGSVDWMISDIYPEGDYVIEINSYASTPITDVISDESDASFKIIKSPAIQVTYICEGGKTINATFYKGEAKISESGEMPILGGSAKISLSDGRDFDLPQTISASGVRYANNDESFIFWSKGNGALVLENNIEKSYIGCITLAENTEGLTEVYANGTIGFSIRYPAGYLKNTSYQYQGLGEGKEIDGVKFIIPSSFAAGTNLSDFDTGISVEFIPATQNCRAELFLLNSQNAQIAIDNDIEYSFTSMNEGAAGNFYEEMIWAISGTNPCIAVRYLIHSTNIGHYPEGTVEEFDRINLIEQFDKVRHSLIVL